MDTSEITFLQRRGFRIIRKDLVRKEIQIRKPHAGGWTRMEKHDDPDRLNRRFEELLQNEKTLAEI